MNPRSAILVVLGLGVAAASTGCYRVTVKSGLPEEPSPTINGATKGGYVNGIVEANPTLLGGTCKGGWAKIYVEESFFNGLTNAFYGLIYHTNSLSVTCAAGDAAPGPAPAPTTTATTTTTAAPSVTAPPAVPSVAPAPTPPAPAPAPTP
jgi:hypothetical protein